MKESIIANKPQYQKQYWEQTKLDIQYQPCDKDRKQYTTYCDPPEFNKPIYASADLFRQYFNLLHYVRVLLLLLTIFLVVQAYQEVFEQANIHHRFQERNEKALSYESQLS